MNMLTTYFGIELAVALIGLLLVTVIACVKPRAGSR
jgi:hypothetical protein